MLCCWCSGPAPYDLAIATARDERIRWLSALRLSMLRQYGSAASTERLRDCKMVSGAVDIVKLSNEELEAARQEVAAVCTQLDDELDAAVKALEPEKVIGGDQVMRIAHHLMRLALDEPQARTMSCDQRVIARDEFLRQVRFVNEKRHPITCVLLQSWAAKSIGHARQTA
ncbi:hypothetical protein WG922_04875 [Ramlibacter sp. AN1015]|uniref:hypothetical protein n=1 Tax=Ramlibacter sp. AN1015 TaxID=3133428 RepID=UPI0030BDB061